MRIETIPTTLALALLALVAACSGGTGTDDTSGMGGQFGEEAGPHCEVDTTTPVAADEPTELGFTVAEVAALVASEAGTLGWADGTTTPFTLGATPDPSSGRVVTQVFVAGEDGMEIGMDCPPYLELDVAVALTTDDGRLAESWDAAFRAPTADALTWWDEVDAFSGSLDVLDFAPKDPSEYDAVRSFVSIGFAPGGSWGEVSGQGEGTDGEVAWAELIDVGQWGTPQTGT